MNLICPHCQKMLTVPDQNAGQLTQCGSCNQTFLVPSLPLPPVEHLEDLPLDIPLLPLPQEPATKAAQPAAHPAADEEGGVYRVAPEPPRTAPSAMPRREERITATTNPASVEPPTRISAPTPPPKAAATQAGKTPPPPPPDGYEHAYTIWISPRVVPWISPVALVLVFLLLFIPWVRVSPGGHPVYWQSGLQTISGSFSTDPVGEKVLNKQEEIGRIIGGNWIRMFFYLVLILAGIALALAPLVVSRAGLKLPPAVQQFWPWRLAVLGGVVAMAFLILFSLVLTGFGLERAVAAPVDEKLEAERSAPNKSAEDLEMLDIRRGRELGALNVRPTPWLRWAVFFNLVALAGIGLEFWLERRGSRLLPRMELHW